MQTSKLEPVKMIAAIRTGCTAVKQSQCRYPACECITIPIAVKAAVEFTIRDAVKVVRDA